MRNWRDDHPRAKLLTEKRTAILDAATRLFIERGYADTSMETVAQEASVGIMTIYRHFASKDDLFMAVMLRACYPTGGPDDAWKSEPPHIAVPAAGRLYLASVLDPVQIGLYRGVVRDARRFPDLARQFFGAHVQRRNATLGQYLAEQHMSGAMNVPRPEWSAGLFGSMLRNEVFEALLFGVRESIAKAESEEIVERISAMFLDMHAPQGSSVRARRNQQA